jgi:lycopene cyclase domain-containing protein
MVIARIDKTFMKENAKPVIAFFVFSTITTTLLEIIFIKTDTWGFTKEFSSMIGYTLLGAPVEEYLFWEFCPLVVIITFLYYKQKKVESVLNEGWIDKAEKSLLTYVEKIKPVADKTPQSEYVDSEVVKKDGYDTYSRGSKVPVYTIFVVTTILAIFAMRKYFKGQTNEILFTAAAFFSVIAPFEQYALKHGVWVYNTQKMLGIEFYGVPVEEWAIYLACPIAGCLFITLFSKKLKGTL